MELSQEAERIQVLREFGILDTEPEASYDQLTEMAATLCAAPVAVISLVDQERQWFKSRVGLTPAETPLDVSFCAHAIQQDSIMIIPDTIEDLRFQANALVVDGPKFRFYAGVPLITAEAQKLGTLCVLDTVPRQLSEREISFLEKLAKQVMSLLESRRIYRLRQAFTNEQAQQIDELKSALNQFEWLDGFLTVCSSCRSIQDENKNWLSLEAYIREHSAAEFSHGICPDCRKRLYPEFSKQ